MSDPARELAEIQDLIRSELIINERARLRQAVAARDWVAQVEHLAELDRLGYRGPESL